MSFAFFLPLLTYPDPTPEAALMRTIDFAAMLGGRLAVSAHVVDIPPITNPLAQALADYASMAAEAETRSENRASSLVEQIKQHAEKIKLPLAVSSFRSRPPMLGEYLATAARAHDIALTVIASGTGAHVEAAEALLFGSGGPVILIPEVDEERRLETVAIAWDGERPAARAVRDALPILRLARRTIVLTALEDKSISRESLAPLMRFLAGHDIAATHGEVLLAGRPIGDALQAGALAHGAGLLAMGAYGHNRLREFVLGGATRTVLSNLRLPTLMSH